MSLDEIKAHCEEHEARMDGAHAKMDKLSDENSGNGSKQSPPLRLHTVAPAGKIVAVSIAFIVVVAVALIYLQVIPIGSKDDDKLNKSPSIDSWSIENNSRTPKIWINASDPDDGVLSSTIEFARKNPRTGEDQTVLSRSYTGQQRTAKVTDTFDLNSGRSLQNENLTNLDGRLIVRVFASDFNGSLSVIHTRTAMIPSANYGPIIVSESIVLSANGMRAWINASDRDDAISRITILIYSNGTPLGSPVIERVYWVNQSTANVTDVIYLATLPDGKYLIISYGTDMRGKDSVFSGFHNFTLPP